MAIPHTLPPYASLTSDDLHATGEHSRAADTLDGSTKDEHWHGLRHGADERSELKPEQRHHEDPFDLEDGQGLSDQENETRLGH